MQQRKQKQYPASRSERATDPGEEVPERNRALTALSERFRSQAKLLRDERIRVHAGRLVGVQEGLGYFPAGFGYFFRVKSTWPEPYPRPFRLRHKEMFSVFKAESFHINRPHVSKNQRSCTYVC